MTSQTAAVEDRRTVVLIAFAVLAILAFLFVRPFITALLASGVLAYVLFPLQTKLSKLTENKNLASALICLLTVIVLLVLIWFALTVVVKEALGFYAYAQTRDVTEPLKSWVATFIGGERFATEASQLLDSLLAKAVTFFAASAGKAVENLPLLLMQVFVLFFTLFYFLRDGDKIVAYLKEVFPAARKTAETFSRKFESGANAVVYGSIIVGIIQGLVAGLGFLLFGVKGVLLLTLGSIFLSILPIVGSWLIWVPVSANSLIAGNLTQGIGLFVYGAIVVSYVDNLIRPHIVSKRARMHKAVALVGMLGGLYFLGIVGLVIGPIFLDFFLLFVDLYKQKRLIELA